MWSPAEVYGAIGSFWLGATNRSKWRSHSMTASGRSRRALHARIAEATGHPFLPVRHRLRLCIRVIAAALPRGRSAPDNGRGVAAPRRPSRRTLGVSTTASASEGCCTAGQRRATPFVPIPHAVAAIGLSSAGFEHVRAVLKKVINFEQTATAKGAHATSGVCKMQTHRFGKKIKLPSTIAIKHQLRTLMLEDLVKKAEEAAI